ncbi:hypothetical protein MUN78_16245 [Leucobacter allii]|uniref:Uncharacterized protein n=1 Tax=Leucobacter allii TaxID=2932247 RepID=A0ABY4FLM2_9MICO|nr:hypothetical protein [Leucobacter allii]UOQ57182.1 hypothetical protein MUN78_16245 [Leucobacter allii]
MSDTSAEDIQDAIRRLWDRVARDLEEYPPVPRELPEDPVAPSAAS